MTEGDSEIMEKCELLAEVIMRFFDAIAGALGATLDSLTLKADQTSRDKKQHAMSHTQLWSLAVTPGSIRALLVEPASAW